MKDLDLTKYGFIREEDRDFEDDGNEFKVYSYGICYVSYLKDEDTYYILPDIYGVLPNEERFKLPHYRVCQELNGIKEENLTDERIEKFKKDLSSYELEYFYKLNWRD